MSDAKFPKRFRLLRPSEFQRVFAAKNSSASAWIVLFGAPNEGGHWRLGLAVSRRVGNSVARNRWKRMLREAFRLQGNQLPAMDYVCIPRAQANPTLEQLLEAIREVDTSHNGSIEFEEYLQLMSALKTGAVANNRIATILKKQEHLWKSIEPERSGGGV